MSWGSRAYVCLIILGGITAVAELPRYLYSEDLIRFSVFALLAVLTATWRISLPGAGGTMSGHFLFVLVAAAQLSAGETLLMAILAVIAQSLFERPADGGNRLVSCLFNIGAMAIAVRITTLTYDIVLPSFSLGQLALRLTLTASAYFIFSTIPVSILDALRDRKSLRGAWKERFLWSFPYHLTGAAISGLLWSVKMAAGWQTATLLVPLLFLVYRWYANYLERLESEKDQIEAERNQAKEMASLHLRTIESLALAIEAKDQSAYNELQRVRFYCTEIGRELGMDDAGLQALHAASLLRDIGKLAVPEHITSKPGSLTPEEFEKMKIHPIIGAEILERVRFPYPVVPIVRHHHERWDGTGYPDGIGGEEIPLGARILSAVDCFDALSSERQYRRALPLAESITYIQEEAGRSFDPKVVEVLARRYQELERRVQEQWTEEDADGRPLSLRGAGPDRAEFVQSIAAARAEAQFIFSVSQVLTQSIDPDTMFAKLSEKLICAIPFDTIVYYRLDRDALRPLYAAGGERDMFRRLRIPLGQGLSGWVAQENKAVLNGNPAAERGTHPDPSLFTNLRAALAVPVEGASGVTGALALYSYTRDAYTRDHLRILMAVSARLAFQVENSLRFMKANGDAFTDELTGLPNSRWLVTALGEACDRAAASNCPFRILVMDLDGFKSLNDTYGHLQGNRALQEIANCAKLLLPGSGTLARMGGDEFVAVLPGRTREESIELAEALQAMTEQVGVRIVGDGRLSCSWGLAEFGADGRTPEELMAEADHRMYAYKRTKQERMSARLARLAAKVDELGYRYSTQHT